MSAIRCARSRIRFEANCNASPRPTRATTKLPSSARRGFRKSFLRPYCVSQETDQAQIALHELESNSQTYRSLYDNFLQRYMESVQQQSFPITEARVISRGDPAMGKTSPNTRKVLAISGLGSADSGFRNWDAARAIRPRLPHQRANRELAEDRLHCTRAVIAKALLINCNVASRRDRLGYCRPKNDRDWVVCIIRSKLLPMQESSRAAKGLFWAVVDAPLSRFAEAIRAIKLTADLNGVVKSNRVIGFTSSLPYEGKSTLAVALAQLISHGRIER